MKVGQTIFNQSSFSFFRIALCRAFVQLAREVLAVTFHCGETEPHQPTGFSSLLLSLGDYLV